MEPTSDGDAVTDRLRVIADRLQILPAHVVALLVLASCACAGLVALWWISRTGEVAQPTIAPALASESGPGAEPSTSPPRTVVVHVSGAVASEGVVELAGGSRVVDAVDAAGGPRGRARTNQLNLARPLRDGEQIHVPAARDGRAAAPSGVALPAVDGPSGAALPAPDGLSGVAARDAPTIVSLNTASSAELETLPNVGPVLAGRIVSHRDAIGGFTAVEQLLEVDGIGDKTFAALRDLVTV